MKENSGIDMTKLKKAFDIEKLPTLREVLLVEETIQDSKDSIVSFPTLKKRLDKKIKQNTLLIILDYFDERNKIATSPKGVTWIQHKKKLLEHMNELVQQSKLTKKDVDVFDKKIKTAATKRFLN